jgi:hypothetical protein
VISTCCMQIDWKIFIWLKNGDKVDFLYSSIQNVIERSFGVLKQKGRILKSMPSFSPRTQKYIIMACFALHNFIRDSNLRDKEFERCDADEQYHGTNTGR